MKLFIFVLILAAFLQASFVPFNLVLVLLIGRSLTLEERTNYFMAFFSGIFLALLTSINIGFWPLLFLVIVKVTHLTKKLPLSANYLTILPLTLVLSLFSNWVYSLTFNQSFNSIPSLVEAVIALPLFIMIKFWEERFEVKQNIKLKIRG